MLEWNENDVKRHKLNYDEVSAIVVVVFLLTLCLFVINYNHSILQNY